MLGVAVHITRFVDASFPGFVECMLTDAVGTIWTFVEKVPMVTNADLDSDSSYPQPAIIACKVMGRRCGPDGSELVSVDTSYPWGIASTTGETRFEVRPEQVTEFDWRP
jgi:hypothetical protein